MITRNGASDRTEQPDRLSNLHRPCTVLLVEDEAILRLDTADALTAAGLSVIEAASGVEATRVPRTSEVDLLMTDVTIPPGPDGLSVARWLRSTRPHVPIIICTSYALSAEERKVADAYFMKPLEMTMVVDRVRHLCQPAIAYQ